MAIGKVWRSWRLQASSTYRKRQKGPIVKRLLYAARIGYTGPVKQNLNKEIQVE